MREEIKSGQAEMRSTHRAFRSELDEMTTCHEAMAAEREKNELDPGMMQSIEERQEIPNEDALVMPVGEPRKRHRVWNLATKRHQKMKERTQGKSRSRRKLAAACRKVSCYAKVAW
jgi:hypothetical protein